MVVQGVSVSVRPAVLDACVCPATAAPSTAAALLERPLDYEVIWLGPSAEGGGHQVRPTQKGGSIMLLQCTSESTPHLTVPAVPGLCPPLVGGTQTLPYFADGSTNPPPKSWNGAAFVKSATHINAWPI